MPTRPFDLRPGRLVSRYRVLGLLGQGWEGEVYRVEEVETGVGRAMKLWYPEHRHHARAVRRYAQKVDRLREVPIVLQYHHHGTARVRGRTVQYIVSELVDGIGLGRFIEQQPEHRMPAFEALHLIRRLAAGVVPIHVLGEYHGDLHADNILVRRQGIGFSVKIIDFFDRGRSTRAMIQEDVFDLVRLLYDALGGQRHYSKQPKGVRQLILGLKRTLLAGRYRNAADLVAAIDAIDWEA